LTHREKDRHRRTRFDIWAAILDLLVNGDETLNGIVTSTRLNHKSAKHHLEDMDSLRLIKIVSSAKFLRYSITNEGKRWIKQYKEMGINPSGKEDNRTDFQ